MEEYIDNSYETISKIIKRHGNNIYVMNQNDFNNFISFMKEKHPAVYDDIKENANFDITPIDFIY